MFLIDDSEEKVKVDRKNLLINAGLLLALSHFLKFLQEKLGVKA
jgi:hypothetical protein